MIKFKFDMPRDFEHRVRKELQKQIEDAIRKAGIRGVRVTLDAKGKVALSGDPDAVKQAEAVLRKMQ